MLISIHPKLPMRNKSKTRDFYINQLGFVDIGKEDYDSYLMVKKDIRTNAIDNLYQTLLDNKTRIHPNGLLELKPWRQKEFSILDPDKNLLTFGESYL